MARRIELREERRHGVSIIRPDGRLDSGQVDRLEELIKERIEDDKKRIVIDCANLHFIASSALRILLLTRQKVEADEGRLIVCNVKPHIKDVLQVAGFDRLLEVRRDLKAAMKDAIPEEMKAEAAAAERRKADAAAETASGAAPEVDRPLDREEEPARKRPATARRVPKTDDDAEHILLQILLLPFRLPVMLLRLLAKPFRRGSKDAAATPAKNDREGGAKKSGGKKAGGKKAGSAK